MGMFSPNLNDFHMILGEVDTTVSSRPTTANKFGLEQLEARVERQNLLIQTLLMLLLEKKVIGEEEFRKWLIYVDELDGKRDGRLKADNTPQECPKCHRKNQHKASQCMYCGEEFAQPEFLDRKPTE